MDKHWLKETLWPQVLFVLAFIAVAALVGFLASFIVVMFTQDVRVIAGTTVVSVWMAEIGVFAWRSRFMLSRRMLTMVQMSEEEKKAERHRMTVRYLLAGAVFAGLLGYACYGIYRDVTAAAVGAGTDEGGTVDGTLLLKIGVTVVLIIVLMFRLKKNR